MLEIKPNRKNWNIRGEDTRARLEEATHLAEGKIVRAENTVRLLETVLRSGDRVNIEGDNQKQADFWQRNFAK